LRQLLRKPEALRTSRNEYFSDFDSRISLRKIEANLKKEPFEKWENGISSGKFTGPELFHFIGVGKQKFIL